MTKRSLLLTCAIGAFAGAICAGAASAAPAEQSGSSATEVGAVVVTAERRDQNLQKVPVAVTAFTKKNRDLTGIITLEQMTNVAPGLVFNAQLNHLFVRGVGREAVNLGGDAGIATYVDGFYTPAPIIGVDPPLFTENVEVLRGPQGTLSGRNGIGGALLITTVRPTPTPYAEARVTVGNYGLYDYEGAVSGPLADGLNFRLAGWGRTQTQGYFHNVDGGPSEGGAEQEYHVEGSITAKLGSNADLFVRAFVNNTDDRGGPGARSGFSPNPLATGLNDPSSPLFFNPAFGFNALAINPTFTNPAIQQNPALGGADPYNFMSEQAVRNRFHNAGDVNYIFTYHFDNFDLKYTGGYQQYTRTLTSDASGPLGTDVQSYLVPSTANPTCLGHVGPTTGTSNCLEVIPGGLVQNYQQSSAWYSHEIVLQSTNRSPIQWVVGAYYYDERDSNPVTEADPDQSQLIDPCDKPGTPGAGTGTAAANAACGLFGFTSAPTNPSGAYYNSNYNLEEKSIAGFGQVDWKVTNTIKLTVGLRYTSDTKGGEEFYRQVDFAGFGPLTPANYGAATPAIDLTGYPAAGSGGVCAAANAVVAKGVTSPCVVNPVTGVASRNLYGVSSATTGTAGAEWTPDNSTLAYFRYSRGYKELALTAGVIAVNPEAGPESINDYELGLKKSFGHNLVVDTDLFYEDYFNFQDYLSTTQPSGLNLSEFTNIGHTYSRGFELEAIWTPVNNLLFNLSYAFDDSGFLSKCSIPGTGPGAGAMNCYTDTAKPSVGRQSASGELPNTPKNKVSLSGQYTWVFDSGKLTPSVSYLWRDQQYGAVFNSPWYVAPSWSQVNLRLTWAGAGDRYEIIAFGDNVFNTVGYAGGAGAGPTGLGPQTGYLINPPATYGLEVHYKFF